MHKSLALALVLIAAMACSISGMGAQAAAINGTGYAIVTPAFDGSGSSPITSYIRFFNGNTATTTFTISIVGSETGQVYGQQFTVQIPPNASPQYSLGQLLVLAGTGGAGAGVSNGDTSYALFIKDPDTYAGYQHVTFNGTTTLFENNSVCNNGLLAAATIPNGTDVLTNVHTSQLSGYPSVIYFFNYASTPFTANVTIVDAGIVEADGKTLSATAGMTIGTTTIQIPANTTVTKNFTDLQTAVNWTPSSTQLHANVLVVNQSNGSLDVILAHSIYNATLGGSINMTASCAVNATSSGGNSSGNSSPQNYTLTVSVSGGTSSGTGTITSSPAGISCGNVCSYQFPAQSTVILTATPGSQSALQGWGEFCPGTGTCTVVMNGNQSVTAYFCSTGKNGGSCGS